MVGSSRDLLRCLDTVFRRVEEILVLSDPQKDPDVVVLNETVQAFLHKHDTLVSIKQTIDVNEHLRRVYTSYIEPRADVNTQTFFLQVLILLAPTLLEEAAMLWLRTYLPTVLDSAGADLKFTERIQELVLKLSCSDDASASFSDEALETARRQIALKTMNHILNIYLGRASVAFVVKQETTGQMQLERQRFMRKNCALFLFRYGEKHPADLVTILDAQFRYPAERLQLLLFLSQFLEANRDTVLPLAGTSFMTSLFKSLLFDNNMYIAEAALNCAYMAIPHVALGDASHLYVSDLLLAFLRLTLWGNNAHIPHVSSKFLGANSIVWNASEFDVLLLELEYVTRRLGRGPSTANIQHFATILYGLVPHNFCTFCKNPAAYITKFPSRITTINYLDQINDTPKKRELISSLYADQLQAFKLHPSFVDQASPTFTDLKLELLDPLSWYRSERTPAQLSLACYKLNFGLVFDIPFSWLDGDGKYGSNGSLSSHNDSHSGSRKGSSAGFLSMTVKDGLAQKIVLENSIRRKGSVDFRETTYDEKPVETNGKTGVKSHLDDLYSVHEKMYGPSDQGSLQILKATSSATTSIETMAVHNSNLKPEMSETKEPSSAVDDGRGFYHRELTILANELEFSNYMRHVTTMQYVELKLKMNELQRENYAREGELAEVERGAKVEKEPKNEMDNSRETSAERSVFDTKVLVDQLEALGGEKAALKTKLEEIEQKHKLLQQSVDTDFLGVLASKEKEIAELKRKMNNPAPVAANEHILPVFGPSSRAGTPLDVAASGKEKRIFDLHTELGLKEEENRRLATELVQVKLTLDTQTKSYETRLSASKLALSESVGKYSLQYEKRIQELSAVILRYEGLLDERNTRIKQLSSLKPIMIPTSTTVKEPLPMGTFSHDRMMDDYPRRRGPGDYMGDGFDPGMHSGAREHSNSSLESRSSAGHREGVLQKPPTSRYNSSSSAYTQPSAPAIKGRGGIQKRSKMKM